MCNTKCNYLSIDTSKTIKGNGIKMASLPVKRATEDNYL